MITQLLFSRFLAKGGMVRQEVIKALKASNIEPENIGRFATFKYEDESLLHVQLSFNSEDILKLVSISLAMDGDESGWTGWSKDREMDRLSRQQDWMTKRGLKGTSSGAIRVWNDFSPQDGASSITITAEQVAAPGGE